MRMLVQIAGTIVATGVFAYGIVFMIDGWASGAGPNIYEILWSGPAVFAHAWFLPIWGVLAMIGILVAIIDRIRQGSK